MATPAPAAFPVPARSSVLRLVCDGLRGITRRDLVLWSCLAVALGLAQGGALSILAYRVTWWRQFTSSFFDAFVPTMLLFLCLAVARHARPRRMPRWTPFAGAAVAAVLLYNVVAFLVFIPIVHALDDATQWPGLTTNIVPGLWMNVPPMVLMCFLVSFGYMYALEARRRVDALRAVQLDGARLGRQSYESRLQAMQARVEPQFLFDTLRQIEQLYETDPSLAERVLDDLIVYLRGVLPSLDDSNSTVSIELEIARAWLAIVEARPAAHLAYSIDKHGDAGASRMPPMILLPLIEHAVNRPLRLPASLQSLAIEASRDGDRLRVVVIDSGGAFVTASETDPVTDVRTRLHALYGSAATLSFAGNRASVELPYERDT